MENVYRHFAPSFQHSGTRLGCMTARKCVFSKTCFAIVCAFYCERGENSTQENKNKQNATRKTAIPQTIICSTLMACLVGNGGFKPLDAGARRPRVVYQAKIVILRFIVDLASQPNSNTHLPDLPLLMPILWFWRGDMKARWFWALF